MTAGEPWSVRDEATRWPGIVETSLPEATGARGDQQLSLGYRFEA
jgi:hypothetical protein